MVNKLFFTSMVTIVGLYGLLIFFLLILFNLFGLSLDYLVIFSVVILFIQFLIAPFLMDLVMRWFYKVKFNYNIPEYLNNYVKNVCDKNNMKYPKIGYIDDGAPNAFTYGRTKNSARIILTRGIFELLSEDEVKSVVSHEIGHAVHYDMFLMTAVQIVPLVLYYIYDITLSSSRSDDDSNKTALIGLVSYFLYVISEYVILWFSRTREYYADEFAINATENPNALANALVKIGYGLTTSKGENTKKGNVSSVSAMGIFDAKASRAFVVSSYDDGKISSDNIKKAARWELWNPWAKWYEFNSTHPLISKRIKAICKYSSKYNQDEYIIFDENKPESYVDDFLLEVFIKFLPLIIILIVFGGLVVVVDTYNVSNFVLFIGISMIVLSISLMISYLWSHKNSGYREFKVSDLLGEVKVSGITSIPCIVQGEIIGKGSPGYIFSEDFVIKDDTGIIFLDYNQPLAIINTLFALLKSREYINKKVVIKGWYRRSPVPYIEIYSMTLDGNTKKCYTYDFTKGIYFVMLLIGVVLVVLSYIYF